MLLVNHSRIQFFSLTHVEIMNNNFGELLMHMAPVTQGIVSGISDDVMFA